MANTRKVVSYGGAEVRMYEAVCCIVIGFEILECCELGRVNRDSVVESVFVFGVGMGVESSFSWLSACGEPVFGGGDLVAAHEVR